MIFLHVLDDFFIQSLGFLANGKQIAWWKREAPDPMYRHDYIMCLIMHSLSWSFMIMLPLAWYHDFNVGIPFLLVYLANAMLHGTVDDLKANRHKLNLIADQCIHLVQIGATALVLLA